MSNALMVLDKFDNLQRAAVALHASGYFSDADSKAKAIAKVMAGAELGLPPFASMTNIHIIKGKPVLGANLIATLIKNDPRYDYRVSTNTPELCEIAFFEDGHQVGVSSFSIEEARKAGVGQSRPPGKPASMLEMYPRNMLFARAISNGARWYTPGIFGGSPVYTPDEMGVEVDEDGFIDGEYSISDNGQHEQPESESEQESVVEGEVEPESVEQPDDLTDAETLVWNAAPQSFGGIVAADLDHYNHAAHVRNTLKTLKAAGGLSGDMLRLDDPMKRLTVYRALVAYAESADEEE